MASSSTGSSSNRLIDAALGFGIGAVVATVAATILNKGSDKPNQNGSVEAVLGDASPILPHPSMQCTTSPSSEGSSRRRRTNLFITGAGPLKDGSSDDDDELSGSVHSQSVHRIGGGASPFRYDLASTVTTTATTTATATTNNTATTTSGGDARGSSPSSSTSNKDQSSSGAQNPPVSLKLPSYHVWRIVLTGGPCSGKSTCMEELKRRMSDSGFIVFVMPEVASMLIIGGMLIGPGDPRERRIQNQRIILQTIMALEDAFYEMARSTNKHCVLLCDRGTMDGRAYCGDEEWDEVMREGGGHSVVELRDSRYDAVVHLVTSAIGAEAYYTQANNAARRETMEEARALDTATRSKWIGHRHLCVVDNVPTESFDDKIERAAQYIMDIVNAKKTQTVVFAVDSDNDDDEKMKELPVESETVEITTYDLQPLPGFISEQAVKRKTHNVEIMYHVGMEEQEEAEETDKDKDNGNGGKKEKKSDVAASAGKLKYVRICADDFHSLLDTRTATDKGMQPRVRNSTSFFFKDRYFKLEENLTVPLPGDWVGYRWRLSAPKDTPTSELPPFVKLVAPK